MLSTIFRLMGPQKRKKVFLCILVLSLVSMCFHFNSLMVPKHISSSVARLNAFNYFTTTTTTTTTTINEFARCNNMGFRYNTTVHNEGCPLSINMKVAQRVTVDEDIMCIPDIEKRLGDRNITEGGFYSPSHCKPKYKIAIIVPYRKRIHQLAIFMNHLHPFLIKQGIDYGIFVIEPIGNLTFNRGLLLNIGFLESLKLTAGRWDCFIFHDVDLIPEDGRNYYTCPPRTRPRHMSSLVSSLDYKLPYDEIFGGVTALTRLQMESVNGYSNFYFGWGAEDDDLRSRIVNNCFKVSRYPLEYGRYLMISHAPEKNTNPLRYKLLKDVYKNMRADGLNSIEYNVSRVVRNKLWTHVYVEYDKMKLLSQKYLFLNETEIAHLDDLDEGNSTQRGVERENPLAKTEGNKVKLLFD